MSRFQALVIVSALSGLLALGCGGEAAGEHDPMVEGPAPASAVGVWTYQSVTVNGASANLADFLDWVPGAVAAELQILGSGAFVYQEVDGTGAQLWFESGFVFFNDAGEVDVNVQQDVSGMVSRMSSFTYAISNDTLTLGQLGGADLVVFTLVR